MRAQAGHAFGVQLIEAASSGLSVHYQPRILQHSQVLRNRWTAYRQHARKLVDGDRSARQLLEDGHPRGIAEGIEPGL